MHRRPTIGITTQTLQAIDGIPTWVPESWVMNQRYFVAATIAGGVPWMIPLLDDDPETLRAVYERLDGLMIPGGVDLDPTSYGETQRPACGRIDPARDRVELQLTRWAIEVPGAIKHDYFPTAGFDRDHLAHEVAIHPGSRLRRLIERDQFQVNSMHHQGIRDLAPPLMESATSRDGLVEAVELDGDHFCIAVQWHPEVFELTDPHTRHLFHEFIAAAQRWAAAHATAG